MPLSDDLIVYPNHGAGSACGKKMSKETTDTLGNQKRTNYALEPSMTEDQFVEAVLTGLTAPPSYFPANVLMNIKGYDSLDSVIKEANKPLNPENFELVANESRALILDTRLDSEFAKGFIPNSINIGLDGSFAMWVGEMITDIKQEILLVTDLGKEEESMIRLSRIGYDHTIGYLDGGFEAWKAAGKEVDKVNRITAEQLEEHLNEKDFPVFDVRKNSEFLSEHLEVASNIPVHLINSHLAEIPKDKAFILHCAGGYRSMIAASLLKQRGYDNFVDVIGGFDAIKTTNLAKTDYVCPSTLL
jgi:rhodanese-related sulfurtransferase